MGSIFLTAKLHLLMAPTLGAAGDVWDVINNITHNITSHYDTVAQLIGSIVFVVGIVLVGIGLWSQARRAAHLGWGIACLVMGASLALAGFTGILNNMFQNTGRNAVGGVLINLMPVLSTVGLKGLWLLL